MLHLDYILDLNLYDKYTLRGYTFKGDRIANQYCLYYEHTSNKVFEPEFLSYVKSIPKDSKLKNKFMCYFFQFRKILAENRSQLSDIDSDDIKIITGDDLVASYYKVEEVCKNNSFSDDFWVQVIKLFVTDLERIIENAPTLNHNLEVFRGVRSHYYSNKLGKIFKNINFTSTSINPDSSSQFRDLDFQSGCCFTKFIIHPGVKCIWMDPVTEFDNEAEILLLPNQSFKIVRKEVISPYYGSESASFLKKGSEENEVDLNLMCSDKFYKESIDYTVMEQI